MPVLQPGTHASDSQLCMLSVVGWAPMPIRRMLVWKGKHTHDFVLQELGQKIAMHAVAMRPQFLDKDSVSAEALEGTRALLAYADRPLLNMLSSGQFMLPQRTARLQCWRLHISAGLPHVEPCM